MTNILIAIKNIVNNPIINLVAFYKGSNRANNMGNALENYIKDAFCNTVEEDDEGKKDILYSQYFSYLGNNNNPPDMILKNGDAIEVKKIETIGAAIALNSSFPKEKLYFDDVRITKGCRECEASPWVSKDIIYIIGVSTKKSNKLSMLWFVYGDCYAANKDIYLNVINKITSGIKEIGDIDFSDTKELAKVKKVDPLGITDLRVRGMWDIKNPLRVFSNHFNFDKGKSFTLNVVILTSKYESLPLEDRIQIEELPQVTIKNIKIKSPNNPAQLLEAKSISHAK